MRHLLLTTLLSLCMFPLQKANANKESPYNDTARHLEGYHHKIHSSQYSNEEKRLLKELWMLTLSNSSFEAPPAMTPEDRKIHKETVSNMTAEEYQAYKDNKATEGKTRFEIDKKKGAIKRIEYSRIRIEKEKNKYVEFEEMFIAIRTGKYSDEELKSRLDDRKRRRDSEIYRLKNLIKGAERDLDILEHGHRRGKNLDDLDEEDRELRKKQMARAAATVKNANQADIDLRAKKLEYNKKKFNKPRSSENRKRNELVLLNVLNRKKKQRAREQEKYREVTEKLGNVWQVPNEHEKDKILAREKRQKEALKKYREQKEN